MMRIRGPRILPRPLTLEQLGERLGCGLAQATALLHARAFPHAFVDCEGKWRVPMADLNQYLHRLRSNGTSHGNGHRKVSG